MMALPLFPEKDQHPIHNGCRGKSDRQKRLPRVEQCGGSGQKQDQRKKIATDIPQPIRCPWRKQHPPHDSRENRQTDTEEPFCQQAFIPIKSPVAKCCEHGEFEKKCECSIKELESF